MRLCVSIPCFFRKTDFCEAIRACASAGYDAVETWDYTALDLGNVKETLCETGVEMLSMCTTEFRMTDPQYRSLWLDGLEKSCRAANELGVKRLITQVGKDTGAPRQLQHESIAEALIAARPILEDSGVILMIEPLNTIVDHKGYYLTSAKEAFELVKAADSPYVKVVYDIYHQQVTEGNIIPSIVNNLDCIAHLHAAGHPGRHELQLGENDYKIIFAAAEKAGYTGACGLEYIPTLDPMESLRLSRKIYG